jgi:hypothetical protein
MSEEDRLRDRVTELERVLRRLARSLSVLQTLEQEHDVATHWRDEIMDTTYGNKTCHTCAAIDEIVFALKEVPADLRR